MRLTVPNIAGVQFSETRDVGKLSWVFPPSVPYAFAASEGPLSPATVVSDSSNAQEVAWTNPGNAATQNNTDATATLGNNQESHYLKATDFSFSAVSGTVDGVVVEIDKASTLAGNDTARDLTVSLVVNGSVVGDNKADTATDWATSDTDAYTSYGANNDTWASGVDATNVKQTDFGIVIAGDTNKIAAADDVTLEIDHMRITVHYTPDAINIFGNLFSDEGDTAVGTSKTLNLAVATGSSATLWSTTTEATTGFYRFEELTADDFGIGTPFLIWVSGDSGTRAALFTAASSTANDIAHADLYQNRVILRHETTSGTTTKNADLSFYDADDDADIQFTANSGALDIHASQELHIATGTHFAPGGNVTIHGNAAAGPDGDLHLSADSATTSVMVIDSTNTLIVGGSFLASSSVIFTNNGTLIFNATTTGKIVIGDLVDDSALASTTFDGVGGEWSFNEGGNSSSASTTNLAIYNGTLTAPSTLLSVSGAYTNIGTFTHNSGTLIFGSGSSVTIGSTMVDTSAFNNVTFESNINFGSDNASTTDFLITSGNTVTAPSSGLLSVAGNYTNNGTFTHNSGTTTLNGTSAQTLSGGMVDTNAFNNVEFTKSGTKNFGANSASTTNFFIDAGSGAVTGPSTLLSFSGVYNNRGTFANNGGTQIFSSGSDIASGSNTTDTSAFGDVVLESDVSWANASTSALTITSGSTMTAPALLTVGGDYVNNGTFIHNSGTVYLTGSSVTYSGSMVDTSAFNMLVATGTGLKTFGANASTTDLTIQASAQVVAPSGLFSISGNFTNNATFSDNTGTVLFDGAGAQTLSGTMTDAGNDFNAVIFSGAGTKTFSGNASTTGNLTILSNSGIVTLPALFTAGGNFTNNGTFATSSGILYFDSGSAQSITGTFSGASDFGNVEFAGANTKTISTTNAIATTTNFTVQSAATVDLSGQVLTFHGDYTQNGTIATTTATKFFFSSTSAQTLSGTMVGASGAFPDVAFLGSGTKTFSADATTTAFTIGSGATVDISGRLLTLHGAYDNSLGGTLTSNGSSYIAFESGSSIVAGSLVTEGSPLSSVETLLSLTLPQASTTDLKISSGTLTAPENGLLSVSGNFTNNGTYASSSATILFDGTSGTQTIGGTLTGVNDLGLLRFSGGAAKTFSANASTTDIVITSGSGTVTFPSDLLSLTSDFTNNGTFAANAGTTTLIGTTTQTLSGTLIGSGASTNNSFANLFVRNTSGDGGTTQSLVFANAASTTDMFTLVASTSVQFPAGETATSSFQNIHWDGGSSIDTRIWLRSSSGGSLWGVDVLGTQEAVEYIDVADSNACSRSGNITATVGAFDSGNNFCWTFPGITISSAANQTFTAGDPATAIETITITDGASASITAANDLRIVISTTTAPDIDMTWDTTDTTATFDGGASGNVLNPVSYEGEGSVLVIPVDNDFDPNESFTISGLSFANFNTATGSASVLSVRAGGPNDTTDDDTDDKTIAINGTLSWDEHSAGQVSNQFSKDTTAVASRELFAFRLLPSGENVSITELIFSLFDVSGIASGDVTNAAIVSDSNNDLSASGETTVWSTDTTSISGTSGSITFSDSVTVSAATDYLLIADIASIGPDNEINMDLNTASDFTATGVDSGASITPTGPVLTARHIRITGGAGGSPVGAAAPASGGDVGGGTGSGGEEIGSEEGFKTPATALVSAESNWANGDDGRVSDDVRASTATNGDKQIYMTYGFSIPSGNEITGIEVKLEANGGTSNSIGVELGIGTATTTSATTTGNMRSGSDEVYTVGGQTFTFGRTWSPSEFNDGTFILELTANITSGSVNLDANQVKVYHQAAGGGGGGGGEVRLHLAPYFASVFESSRRFFDALTGYLAALRF